MMNCSAVVHKVAFGLNLLELPTERPEFLEQKDRNIKSWLFRKHFSRSVFSSVQINTCGFCKKRVMYFFTTSAQITVVLLSSSPEKT